MCYMNIHEHTWTALGWRPNSTCKGISKASAICQDISTCMSAYLLSNRTDHVGAILNIYIWGREQWRMFATIPLFPLMDEINLKICKYGFSFEITLVLCPKLIPGQLHIVLSNVYTLSCSFVCTHYFWGAWSFQLTTDYTIYAHFEFTVFYSSLFCSFLRAWDSLSPRVVNVITTPRNYAYLCVFLHLRPLTNYA
jgi:hypothetical protein